LNDGTAATDLTLTAAQATGRSITGTADIAITAATPATAYNFSQLDSGANVNLTFVLDGQVSPSSNLTNVDSVILATGTTTMTAVQANGVSFSESPSTASLSITGSDGVQSLRGSAGNDTFATGSGTDTVDIDQGGSDTLLFSGQANDMVITGFDHGALSTGGDVLDFSGVSNLGSSGSYRAFNSLTGGPEFTETIIGLTLGIAETAQNVETLFKQSENYLNNKISAARPQAIGDIPAHAGSQSSMLFLISNSAANAVNIWHWVDADNNFNLSANEVTMLGTLQGVVSADLVSYVQENFIV